MKDLSEHVEALFSDQRLGWVEEGFSFERHEQLKAKSARMAAAALILAQLPLKRLHVEPRSNFTRRLRLEAVSQLWEAGLQDTEISRLLNIRYSTVQEFILRRERHAG